MATEEEIQEKVEQAIQTAEKFTDIFYKQEFTVFFSDSLFVYFTSKIKSPQQHWEQQYRYLGFIP